MFVDHDYLHSEDHVKNLLALWLVYYLPLAMMIMTMIMMMTMAMMTMMTMIIVMMLKTC